MVYRTYSCLLVLLCASSLGQYDAGLLIGNPLQKPGNLGQMLMIPLAFRSSMTGARSFALAFDRSWRVRRLAARASGVMVFRPRASSAPDGLVLLTTAHP